MTRKKDSYIAGNRNGGLKAKAKNLAKNPEHYTAIGSKGGKAKNPKKGFGSMTPKQRSEAGRKGGTRSRKIVVETTDERSKRVQVTVDHKSGMEYEDDKQL